MNPNRVDAPPIDLDNVARSDGTRCQTCGKPIPPATRNFPGPFGPIPCVPGIWCECGLENPPIVIDPITYDWLLAHGWHRLDREERQPFDHCRRCIGRDVIGDLYMAASEDLCIEVSPTSATMTEWFVWITKAHSQNNFASVWLHVRYMRRAAELILLYEGLTGRRFGLPTWNAKERAEALFQ